MFDEVTHILEVSYKYMFSRLRRLLGSGIPLKVRGASNPPDDDGGIWVFDRFVNPETRKKKIIYIPAGLDDNPYLDKDEYEEALEELDPVSRARLRDGNWDVKRHGNMFKRDWFQTVEAPPLYRKRVRFWDMAATEANNTKGKQPDWTVGALVSEADGIYYIEDIIRMQARPKDTEEAQATAAKVDGYSTQIREEEEPGSSGTAVIDLKSRTLFKSYDYKGVKSTGSKTIRANAFSAVAERGHVKIVKGCRNIEAFLNEAESFPGGVNDDIIDAISGAFNSLRQIPDFVVPIEIGGNKKSYWEASDTEYGNGTSYWRG